MHVVGGHFSFLNYIKKDFLESNDEAGFLLNFGSDSGNPGQEGRKAEPDHTDLCLF